MSHASKEKIMSAPQSSGNDGRLSHESASVESKTMPKMTNSETHGGKNDVANTESAPVNSASHGKQKSNSQ